MIGVYLTDRATWLRDQGKDEWGEPHPRLETVVRCRIVYRAEVVRDMTGAEVVSRARLLVTEKPAYEDRYRFEGREHPILSVDRKASFDMSHYEVHVA